MRMPRTPVFIRIINHSECLDYDDCVDIWWQRSITGGGLHCMSAPSSLLNVLSMKVMAGASSV